MDVAAVGLWARLENGREKGRRRVVGVDVAEARGK